MYEEHPSFEPPDRPNSQIWRYMDLTRFIWMLENQALYFARADLLGDPHEGTTAKPNIREREDFWAGREIQWAPGLSGHEDIGRLMVRSTYVSCWNLSEIESAFLWDLYGRGVAIRSTFAGLRDSLQCEEPVHIGAVRYIDYRRDRIPGSSVIEPLMHKRKYFENERELRAVIVGKWVDEGEEGWQWAKEDPRRGIEARVDLEQLVDEVRIAPADPILGNIVPALVERYSLKAPVAQSSLDDAPEF